MASILRISLINLILISTHLSAKDLGSRGHTFEIQEDDFLLWMKKQISSLSDSEVINVQKKVQDHYTALFQEPKKVKRLSETKQYRVSYFDPTVCSNQDIRNHEGKLIVSKGEKFNPLQLIALSDDLLFFDGTNPTHLLWAKSQKFNSRWVLTQGHPLNLEKEEERPIYFDQLGVLVKKLNIHSIPARVSQEGNLLKIEEFPIKGDA